MRLIIILFTVFYAASSLTVAHAAPGGSLNEWDSDFSDAMNDLDTAKTPPVQSSAVSAMPMGALQGADEQLLENREDFDTKARMARLENKIIELEREQRTMSDRIRNLDRQVNDLKRKV